MSLWSNLQNEREFVDLQVWLAGWIYKCSIRKFDLQILDSQRVRLVELSNTADDLKIHKNTRL